MMNSEKVEDVVLERPIEIYENERLWIGRGFSKAGLLPTERGPFSTEDGSLSWKTMREASLALLRGEFANVGNGNVFGNGKGASKRVRRGWSFREGDADGASARDSDKVNLRREDEHECSTGDGEGVDPYCGFIPCIGPADGPVDAQGWQYFPDFLPLSLSSPNKRRGMLDFVRRRKLRRVAIFRPDHFLPREVYINCDFCDSSVVDMLSSAMLDALALAALFAHGPKADLTDAQVLTLKSKLIDSLAIGSNCSNEDKREDFDPWIDIHRVKDRLCTFAEECVGKPGPLVHLLNPDVDRNLASAMPVRRREMATYLDEQERLNLARLLVKDVDRYSYKMHCGNSSCACKNNASNGSGNEEGNLSTCEFRLVTCLNEHCDASFSFKHRIEHDEECGYKLLPCPSGCGTEVPRKEMHIHVRDKCSLRASECPLAMLGCTAIVQAQDVTSHLNSHADKHFMLIANRMTEYQTVMKDLSAQVRVLEEKNGRLERELKHATVQLQSKNEAKAVTTDVKKLTKRLATLEGTCKKEFKRVEQDRRSHQK